MWGESPHTSCHIFILRSLGELVLNASWKLVTKRMCCSSEIIFFARKRGRVVRIILVSFILGIGMISQVLAQVKISAPREISDFINIPLDVQVVDMNGDGFPDIVCREEFGGKIVWWQNDGTGQFPQRHVKEWSDVNYWCFGLADANSDGKPDVWFSKPAEVNSEMEMLYLSYAQADGTFAEPVLTHPTWTKGNGLLLDCNGDGRLDLLVEDEILLQNSDATFTHITNAVYTDSDEDIVSGRFVPEWSGYQIAALGRIRPALVEYGSGVIDYSMLENLNRKVRKVIKVPASNSSSLDNLWIVVSDLEESPESHKLLRLSFTSSGNYQIEQEIEISCEGVKNALAYRDSQKVRLLISAYDRMFMVTVPNDGSPAVVTTMSQFTGKNSCAEFAVADLNGDGNKEVVIATTDVPFTSGHYFSQIEVMNLSANGFPTNAIESVNHGNLAEKILWTGDYDLDGDQDFITNGHGAYEYRNRVLLWKNSGGGVGFTMHLLLQKDYWLELIEVIDVNNDGRPDLVTFEMDEEYPNIYGLVKIHLNMATGTLQQLPFNSSGNFSTQWRSQYVDINGDGLKDIVNSQKAYLLDSDRNIIAERNLLNGLEISDFQLIDLDLDGDLDLFFTNHPYGGGLYPDSYYSLHSGDAVFSGITRLGDGSPRALGADVDGDGHEDFFDAEGYLLLRPNMNLVRPSWDGLLTGGGGGLGSFFLDIDGDADVDLLNTHIYNFTTGIGDLGWLENRGNVLGLEPQYVILPELGQISVHRQITPDRYLFPGSAKMVDLDGDGIRDILVSHNMNRKLEWFKVTKPVVPTTYDQWMSALGWQGNSAGPFEDLDGDGKNNWREFVFQSDPLVADLGHENGPQFSLNSGVARMEFKTRGDVPGVVCQSSDDLLDWFNRADVFTELDASTGLKRWILEEPVAEGRKFFRVRFPEPAWGP